MTIAHLSGRCSWAESFAGRRISPVEVVVLNTPDGDAIACGANYGGPDYEFVAAPGGPVYFHVAGDAATAWAGPDADTFRRIAVAWNRYGAEVVRLPTESAKLERVAAMRRELDGARGAAG